MGPSRCIRGDGAPVARTIQVEQLEGPEGASVPGLFFHVGTSPMRMTRDWWAVLLAAAAVVLVKLGVVQGVPW
jgi:hypothetical protein